MSILFIDKSLVILYGFLIGVGNGIYWSCRNFLTLLVTNNENLNFYTSVEQFIIIFCNALIPLLFGTFVLGNTVNEDAKMQMYKYTSLVVIATNLIACWLVMKSNFKNPDIKKFMYASFSKDWQLQRMLTFFVGMVESGFMVLMTLLILTVAGDESVLGKIEFTTAIISIISIYIVGRISKPHHRGRIMLVGAGSLIIGGTILAFTITNQNLILGLSVSFLGVIMMKISQVVADPMVHSAFRATYMSSCDKISVLENRDSYTYIMDNEYFMNGGRIFGGFVFLVITYLFYKMGNGIGGLSEALSVNNHDVSALRFTFIILAFMQLLSAFLIQKLNKISVDVKKTILVEL
jgi:YQGE family putative transporter